MSISGFSERNRRRWVTEAQSGDIVAAPQVVSSKGWNVSEDGEVSWCIGDAILERGGVVIRAIVLRIVRLETRQGPTRWHSRGLIAEIALGQSANAHHSGPLHQHDTTKHKSSLNILVNRRLLCAVLYSREPMDSCTFWSRDGITPT